MEYSDYTTHYACDAADMPMPEDMGYFRHHFERRRFTLMAGLFTSAGGRILDAGCGNGWLAGMLAGRGYTVDALDIGIDSLRRARGRFGDNGPAPSFVCGDVYSLPFGDGVFDGVAVSEMLEHLAAPERALGECARVLRSGGEIVVSTPYSEIIEYTRCIHCNQKTPVNAHLHSFDRDSLAGLLAEAGFSVARTVLFGSRPAERLGLAGLTGRLPHGAWRTLDALACRLAGRQSFITLRAVKHA